MYTQSNQLLLQVTFSAGTIDLTVWSNIPDLGHPLGHLQVKGQAATGPSHRWKRKWKRESTKIEKINEYKAKFSFSLISSSHLTCKLLNVSYTLLF